MDILDSILTTRLMKMVYKQGCNSILTDNTLSANAGQTATL